jgi:NTE family protein
MLGSKTKIGLALGGGGGMGAYQMGVLRALVESGWLPHITHFSGCSVGALNLLFFTKGDWRNAQRIWQEEVAGQLINFKSNFNLAQLTAAVNVFSRFITKNKSPFQDKLNELTNSLGQTSPFDEASLLSNSYLKLLIDNHITSQTFKGGVKSYATATPLDVGPNHYFLLNENDLDTTKSILLASSAIPSIFAPQKVGNYGYFMDGGVGDNLPISPLIKEGCQIIISSPLIERGKIRGSRYPHSAFIELIPSPKIGPMLNIINFSPSYISKMMDIGYSENIEKLVKYYLIASAKLG